MSTILAIDPGNTESGWAVIDAASRFPLAFGKTANYGLRGALPTGDVAVIEMVASYGMPVGREVFETCVWIGRFQELLAQTGAPTELIYRKAVKLHHCGSAKAKDGNIIQALVDRFAAGQANRGKGTKADPGWFHGFAGDVWQAYALAVLKADELDPDGARRALL